MMQREILIDIGRLERRLKRNTPTGVDRVILAYCRYLYEDRKQRVTFSREILGHPVPYNLNYARKIIDYTISRWQSNEEKTPIKRPSTAYLLTNLLADLIRYAVKSKKRRLQNKLYLSLDHNGFGKSGPVQRLARSHNNKIISFLHDLIPLTHPEYVRPQTVQQHFNRILQMAHCSDLVIANSSYTLFEFERFLEAQNKTPPPMIYAPLGVELEKNSLMQMPSDITPRFVVLGTIEARKNHAFLLTVWKHIVYELGENSPHLYVIGKRGWEAEGAEDLLDRCEILRPFVHEMTNLSDHELQKLLKSARALLFPSHVEGFGLPLMEAYCARTPAIVSDIAAFREISGNIPEYLSPIDGNGWKDMILRYADKDSPERAAQLARLEDFRPTNWSQHFEKAWPKIKDLLN